MANEWDTIFDELEKHQPQFELNGKVRYIVEGDLALNAEELADYARARAAMLRTRERNAADASGAQSIAEDPPDRLIANIDESGRAVRWAPNKLLSYTVLRSTFVNATNYPANYDLAVRAMRVAAADWQEICNVRIQHLAELDDRGGAGAIFTVEAAPLPQGVIALAFFPHSPPADRRLLLGAPFFNPALGYDPAGVLRHELGHVLGFRHEHIRSGAPPICQGEPNWNTVNITDYDPQSVMHYFCGGVGSKTMKLTDKDRLGARWLYGPSDSTVRYVQ